MAGRVPTFLINFPGIPSGDLSAELAERGFGVWSGDNYYAPGLYERIAWGDALRVGLAHYNTLAEIDRLQRGAGRPGQQASMTAAITRKADIHPQQGGSGALTRVMLDAAGAAARPGPAAGRRGPGRGPRRDGRARRRAVVRDRRGGASWRWTAPWSQARTAPGRALPGGAEFRLRPAGREPVQLDVVSAARRRC